MLYVIDVTALCWKAPQDGKRKDLQILCIISGGVLRGYASKESELQWLRLLPPKFPYQFINELHIVRHLNLGHLVPYTSNGNTCTGDILAIWANVCIYFPLPIYFRIYGPY